MAGIEKNHSDQWGNPDIERKQGMYLIIGGY